MLFAGHISVAPKWHLKERPCREIRSLLADFVKVAFQEEGKSRRVSRLSRCKQRLIMRVHPSTWGRNFIARSGPQDRFVSALKFRFSSFTSAFPTLRVFTTKRYIGSLPLFGPRTTRRWPSRAKDSPSLALQKEKKRAVRCSACQRKRCFSHLE